MDILEYFKRFFDKRIEDKYLDIGIKVGEAINYSHWVDDVDLKLWKNLEIKYASKGYKTASPDSFVKFNESGKLLNFPVGKKRKEGEKPIFYHKLYEKTQKQILADLEKITNEGNYRVHRKEVFVYSKEVIEELISEGNTRLITIVKSSTEE